MYMFPQQVVPLHAPFNQINFPNPKLNTRLKNVIIQGPPPYQPRFTTKITGKRTKFTKFQNYPTQPQINQKVSKLNPSIHIHIPHTQNYFASFKTNNHPTTPILRPPPPTQIHTQYKRLKSGNSVRNHH